MSSYARCLSGEHERFTLSNAKRLDCVMRETRCRTDAAVFHEAALLAVQNEIVRMRHLGVTYETTAAFLGAAQAHLASSQRGGSPPGAKGALFARWQTTLPAPVACG